MAQGGEPLTAASSTEGSRGRLSRLVAGLVTLFLLATVLAPASVLNKLVFGLLLVFGVLHIGMRPTQSVVPTLSPLIVAVVYLYGMFVSVGGGSDMALARQLLLSTMMLFLIYPVVWYRVDLDHSMKVAGVAVACGTAVYTFGSLASVLLPGAGAIVELMDRYSMAAGGFRTFLGSPVPVYRLGAAPLLLIPFLLFVMDIREGAAVRGIAGALVVGAAIMASSTRALVLLAAVGAMIVMIEGASRSGRVGWSTLAWLGVCAAVAVLPSTEVFSPSEFSNAIKLGHLRSFADNLDLHGALFGDGLANIYFSSGVGRSVAQTEITWMDQVRYFGFPATVLIAVALVFPLRRPEWYRVDRSRQIALAVFGMYVLLSFTNPVLFNSYGLSVVVWYWWRMLRSDALSGRVLGGT